MPAYTAAAAVPQAMAIPVAILGWVMSGKGIIRNLLWGTLPETCAGYKDVWLRGYLGAHGVQPSKAHLAPSRKHSALCGLGSDGNQ